VHDYPVIQDASDTSILEEGMILAVEPYVVVGNEKYAVEDDVLVTTQGPEILSANLQSQEMWPISDSAE
jgi:Xaa-Pro aminopeptidase